MNKPAAIALVSIFAAALGGAGYEAYQLNDLVWSSPDQGDIKFWGHNNNNADMVLELERNSNLIYREDYTKRLSVYFDTNSPDVSQACIVQGYDISGIYHSDPEESPLAQKYLEHLSGFEGSKERFKEHKGYYFNEYSRNYVQKDCSDAVKQEFSDELENVVEVRKSQLEPS